MSQRERNPSRLGSGSGQILIPVLFLAALAGMVFLGFLPWLAILLKAKRGLSADFTVSQQAGLPGAGHPTTVTLTGELDDTVRLVHLILSNTDLCRCNFGGRSFAVGTNPSYNIGSLRLYNNTCSPGNVLLQTGGSIRGGVVQVQSVRLTGLTPLDAFRYQAALFVTMKRKSVFGGPAITKEVDLVFSANTRAGMVTLNSCAAVNTVVTSCVSNSYYQTFPGQSSEAGMPVRACQSPTQVMTQCSAVLYKNGEHICTTHIQKPLNQVAYCYTDDCLTYPDDAGQLTQRWGVSVTCCDFNLIK